MHSKLFSSYGNNQMENLCTFIHYHCLESLHQIIQSKMLCSYANKEPFTMYCPSFYSGVCICETVLIVSFNVFMSPSETSISKRHVIWLQPFSVWCPLLLQMTSCCLDLPIKIRHLPVSVIIKSPLLTDLRAYSHIADLLQKLLRLKISPSHLTWVVSAACA